jgi:hypothetical protein
MNHNTHEFLPLYEGRVFFAKNVNRAKRRAWRYIIAAFLLIAGDVAIFFLLIPGISPIELLTLWGLTALSAGLAVEAIREVLK